jgi:DNA-directed RNA polymerase specialized sigma24 family protein
MSKNSSNGCADKTDRQLVKLVRDNASESAFKEICDRYENIFYKVCQKYVAALRISGINPQDIFDEKDYIIFHCIRTFNYRKGTKLSTWIGNYARYLCLNSINSRKFILPSSDEEITRHIEETQATQNYISSQFTPEDFGYILNIISQLKDKRVEEIFKYRYFNDKKMIWSKIAKKMKISTQTAINLHNKGITLLRKKVKSPVISDVV